MVDKQAHVLYLLQINKETRVETRVPYLLYEKLSGFIIDVNAIFARLRVLTRNRTIRCWKSLVLKVLEF